MKRFFALATALMLASTFVVGCSKKEEMKESVTVESSTPTGTETTTTETTTTTTGDAAAPAEPAAPAAP